MALKNLSRSIEGCVAVITGAGSGMGAATAKLFAEEEPMTLKNSAAKGQDYMFNRMTGGQK